jgi:hypothetical protein
MLMMEPFRHNSNDILNDNVDWTAGLVGLERRWLPYNGAVSPQQLQWLRDTLTSADNNKVR